MLNSKYLLLFIEELISLCVTQYVSQHDVYILYQIHWIIYMNNKIKMYNMDIYNI